MPPPPAPCARRARALQRAPPERHPAICEASAEPHPPTHPSFSRTKGAAAHPSFHGERAPSTPSDSSDVPRARATCSAARETHPAGARCVTLRERNASWGMPPRCTEHGAALTSALDMLYPELCERRTNPSACTSFPSTTLLRRARAPASPAASTRAAQPASPSTSLPRWGVSVQVLTNAIGLTLYTTSITLHALHHFRNPSRFTPLP